MSEVFEVGQPVTIDNYSYLNSLPGLVLDVSGSDMMDDSAIYTVEVEEQGTHYFYGSDLSSREE